MIETRKGAEVPPAIALAPKNGKDLTEDGRFEDVPVALIDKLEFQARSDLDPREVESLAQTMKRNGLHHPILLRPKGDRYDLVAGEQRLMAAKSLGWTTIPARIKVQSDTEAAINRLVENIQRRNWNPLDQAHAFEKLQQPPYNLTAAQISEQLSRPPWEISRALKLLKQPQEIQDLVKRRVFRERHARALALVEDPDERVKLAAEAAEKGWTVKQIETRARRAGKGKGGDTNAIEDSAAHTPEQAATDMLNRLGGTPSVGARSEHPLRKAVQNVVDGLPVNTPFIRVAVSAAIIAVVTSIMAGVVGTPWLRLALEGVTGLFWLAAGVLFIRYVTVHRARLISRMVHWVELTRSISSKDARATHAAAHQLELDSTQAKTSNNAPKDRSRSEPPTANH